MYLVGKQKLDAENKSDNPAWKKQLLDIQFIFMTKASNVLFNKCQ